MSSPITEIRDIVREHEANSHSRHDIEDGAAECNCMERIGYIMQVFYPEGIEFSMSDDEDYDDRASTLDSDSWENEGGSVNE